MIGQVKKSYYNPLFPRWFTTALSSPGLCGQTTSLGGTISCWWSTVLLIFSYIRLRWLTQNQVLRNKKKCQFKDFKFREALLLQLRCKKAPKRRESAFHLTGQQLLWCRFWKDRKGKDSHFRETHTCECIVCDYKLKNKEELGIHLLTCEIYTCSMCTYRNKRLSELKSHCKTSREKFLKVSCTSYFSE